MTSVSRPLRPEWLEVSQERFRKWFQELESLQDLANLLEVKPSQLSYYALRVDKEGTYSRFVIPKRRGKPREIDAPLRTLKYLQRLIHESMNRIYSPHPAVHGFVKGRSFITNAECHLSSRYVLTIDLQDFFPSITRQRVYGRLKSAPYRMDSKIANLIASLATGPTGRLPQGSPCSPVLANMVAAQLDADLATLAASKYCTYTRYADDITISTKREALSPQIARYPNAQVTSQVALGDELLDVIARHSFRVNFHKNRLQSYWTRQTCTGLVVNGAAVSVPRPFVRRLRTVIHRWVEHGWRDAAAVLAKGDERPEIDDRAHFERVVRGKLEYVRMVCGNEHPSYARMAQRIGGIPDEH